MMRIYSRRELLKRLGAGATALACVTPAMAVDSETANQKNLEKNLNGLVRKYSTQQIFFLNMGEERRLTLKRGAGKSASPALLRRFSGQATKFEAEGNAVKITPNESSAGILPAMRTLTFSLLDLPCNGEDLLVAFTIKAAPRPGHPELMPRQVSVGVSGQKQRLSTFANPRPFAATIYFRKVQGASVTLDFEIEGGEPVWISNLSVHAHPDAMVRVFDRGIVLGNPADHAFTFDLKTLVPDAEWVRLKGSSRQDPATNNGQPVTGPVTLAAREASLDRNITYARVMFEQLRAVRQPDEMKAPAHPGFIVGPCGAFPSYGLQGTENQIWSAKELLPRNGGEILDYYEGIDWHYHCIGSSEIESFDDQPPKHICSPYHVWHALDDAHAARRAAGKPARLLPMVSECATVKLRARGYDKLNGRAQVVDASRESRTLRVEFTPRQHGMGHGLPDPAYVLLALDHDGKGAVTWSNPRITVLVPGKDHSQ